MKREVANQTRFGNCDARGLRCQHAGDVLCYGHDELLELEFLKLKTHLFLKINCRALVYRSLFIASTANCSLCCVFIAHCRRNILKISLFYGDIKYSAFTQSEAYDVKTLLGICT